MAWQSSEGIACDRRCNCRAGVLCKQVNERTVPVSRQALSHCIAPPPGREPARQAIRWSETGVKPTHRSTVCVLRCRFSMRCKARIRQIPTSIRHVRIGLIRRTTARSDRVLALQPAHWSASSARIPVVRLAAALSRRSPLRPGQCMVFNCAHNRFSSRMIPTGMGFISGILFNTSFGEQHSCSSP